ncbi:MAG: phosphoribosylaminoimidazolesuccinocarboxamide synthase [Chloroflexota bacterium]
MSAADVRVDAFLRSGKVRDLYALEDGRLLLVASDRLSAFDVVLPTPIPDKGRILTGLSRHWFAAIAAAGIVPHHVLATDPAALPPAWAAHAAELRGRILVCRRAAPLPIELIVRGYLAGSGWAEYRASGSIGGIALPPGLREGDRLPTPIFTPSPKAEVGHDLPLTFDETVALVGGAVAERAREIALAVYRLGAADAEAAGIIVADTKIELGLLPEDAAAGPPAARLLLIDEVLTPDSSRFWEAAAWAPGQAQASYDKQYVRDWLLASGWDRRPPGPELPPEIVAGTAARYRTAFERICRTPFARYLEEDRIGS